MAAARMTKKEMKKGMAVYLLRGRLCAAYAVQDEAKLSNLSSRMDKMQLALVRQAIREKRAAV